MGCEYPVPWYMYVQPETIWLYIAFTGALSFPFFIIQLIVFYILKLKKWTKINIILIIISITVSYFCFAYIAKDYHYSREKIMGANDNKKMLTLQIK